MEVVAEARETVALEVARGRVVVTQAAVVWMEAAAVVWVKVKVAAVAAVMG